MIDKVIRVRHLTESLPLAVYNDMFSRQHEQKGGICFYDAKTDGFTADLPPSKSADIEVDGIPQKPLLRFD